MTLEEIARELNLSKSTVSRALSGKGRISDKTRQLVRSYAGGGQVAARGSRRLTRNLGLIFPSDIYSNGNPYFLECMLGICETAALMDYNVLLTMAASGDLLSIERLVEQGKADGVILTRNQESDRAIHYLTDNHIPTGLTGLCDDGRVIQVDTDNEAAAENLTTLLIKSGYGRLALIAGDMSYQVNRSRYNGFYSAVMKNGLVKELQCFYRAEHPNDLMDTMISDMLAKKVECVVCGDDVICARLISRLQALGYRIPRDIAVASLYNSPILESFVPSVTTVDVSARKVGNIIGKQLIQCLEGKPYQNRTMVDYDILLRKSTSRL